MKNLVWFRRDLRITDNAALYHAAKAADTEVIGLYILTPQQWQEHDDAPAKISFWLENIRALSNALQELNIPLIVKTCATFAESAKLVTDFACQKKCDAIFLNREYEVNETRRDQQVEIECENLGVRANLFHDRVIVPPEEISTKDGRFYSVFTPYRRVWDTRALEFAKPFAKPKKRAPSKTKASVVPTKVSGFDFQEARPDLWPASEAEAKKRLTSFANKISNYDEGRDIPSINGTSLLSPYLNAGIVSPRQCLQAALKINKGSVEGGKGATTWISELTWRDFYTHVMSRCPRVSMNRPFKLKTEAINWREDDNDFEAWATGRTGYPIVDAGMRQLNQTGWMHNRLRMVTAMFLTKNLLIDWRLGERYFMQKLIDGDLAANNGGWQWSASTGTDSVPYFRIFNPFSQSKRFDVDGKFIKKFCPELSDVPATALHDPKKLAAAIAKHQCDYPEFVVDYKAGRERALQTFKALSAN